MNAIGNGIKSTFENVLNAIFDLIPGGQALKRRLALNAISEAADEAKEALEEMGDVVGGVEETRNQIKELQK